MHDKPDVTKSHALLPANGDKLEREDKQRTARLENAKKKLKNEIVERKRAEQKIRRQVDLLENISDAIISTDLSFNILSWNSAAEAIYGWQREEVCGKSTTDVLKTEFLNSQRKSALEELLTQGHWQGEVIQRRKDGTAVDIFFSASLITDGSDSPIGAMLVNRDITERKHAEQRLRQSEERFRALTDLSPAGICLTDKKGDCLYVNPRWCAIAGLSKAEAAGRGWARAIHPEDREHVVTEWYRLVDSQDNWDMEFRFLTADGKCTWVHGVGSPLRDDEGNLSGYIAVDTDITERKVDDEALKKSEGLLRETQRLAKIGGWEYNVETGQRFWSDEVYHIHEMEPESNPGWDSVERSLECYDPDDRPVIEAAFRRCVENGEPFDLEFPFTSRKGNRIWIRTVANAVRRNGKIVRVIGNIMDVSERKRTEEALLESEAALSSFFNSASTMMGIVDVFEDDIMNISANPSAGRFWGIDADSMRGKLASQFGTSREYIRKWIQHYRKAERTKEPVRFEYERQRNGGQPAWLLATVDFISRESGDPMRCCYVIEDITERKQAEQTLRESEAKFRHLMEATSASVFIFQDKIMKYVNPAACSVTGYSQRELLQMNFWEVVHPDFQDLVRRRGNARQKDRPVPRRYQVKLLTKDKEERWVDFTGNLIEFEGQPAILGTAVDITDRVYAESELSKSRQQLRNLSAHLQSVREEERTHIARELHDNLGQALSTLQIDLSWLETRLAEDRHGQVAEKIESMSKLIRDTIETVQEVSRELRPSLLDNLGLLASVDWQAKEFQKRTGITCQLTTPDDEIDMAADVSIHLFRIFQEALTNVARHANATRVKTDVTKKGDRLTLIIEDNGAGISRNQSLDSNSIGIIGMRERANLVKGSFRIDGAPKQGTRLCVSVPLKPSTKSKPGQVKK